MFVGLHSLATKKDSRSKFLAEIQDDPLGSFFGIVMVTCGMACFWGVMIPPLGTIPIYAFGMKLAVWSAGGIGFLIFLGLLSFWLGRKNKLG